MRHTIKAFALLTTAALLPFTALAQQNIITTAIGGGPNDMPAIDADLYQPVAVAVDSAGNYYFADSSQNRVFKVNTSGILTVVAGSGIPGFAGDGVHGGAPNALLNNPSGVAVDSAGNIYISDTYNGVVRKVDTSNTITTIAGEQGQCSYEGNGSPATNYPLCNPLGLAVDSSGNLYIADQYNSIVRKLVVSTSTISNYAGNGTSGYSGDGAAATGAQLYYPSVVAVDSAGNVYIADSYNYRVREVTISNGHIRTIAGNGTAGYTGDAGAATSATFNQVLGIAVNSAGTKVTIADTYNVVIRQFTVGGTINTIAGGAGAGWCGDGGLATSSCFYYPEGVAVTSAGSVYVADTSNNRIRLFTVAGNINTVAGDGNTSLPVPVTGVPPTGVVLNDPWAALMDPSGNIFVADQYNSMVREMVASSNLVNFFAGTGIFGYRGDGGIATSAELSYPSGIARDSNGNLYIADTNNCAIRMVNTTGFISTIAGTGVCSYTGDGGPATSATLNSPYSVFVDSHNIVYIADTYNNVVRRINGGTITTVAGDGTAGSRGDGSLATAAQMYYPFAVAEDGAGNLYIADYYNCRIREVFAATGTIDTVAGSVTCGFSGDGIATENALYYPSDVKADANGNLFIADTSNQRLRWVSPSGIMTTFAGSGTASYFGDGGPAEIADFYSPVGIFEDPAGNFLVADQYNLRVRRISAFAGLGTSANNLTFGMLAVGSTSEPLALTLSGVGPLTIGAILVTGPFAESDNCGSSLPNGQACTVYVYFKPTAAGTGTGTLTIENNGYFNGASVVSLEGTGTAISVTGAPVTFGNQLEKTTSAVQSVTISNKGKTGITMGAITLSETTDFAIFSNSCPASGSTLAASATCTIGLTFTPKSTGAKKGVLSINDSDPTSPQLAGMTGTGTSNVSFAPAAAVFPAQAIGTASISTRIVLTNKSGAAITLGNPAASVTGPFLTTSSTTCTKGKAIANNGTCLIYVEFMPTAAGYATGTLSVADTDTTSPQTVALSGMGTGIEFSPSPLNFGSVTVGTQATATVTITNVGLHTITFTGAALTGAIPTDFMTNVGEPPCGGSLLPAGTCMFTVYFTPSVVGNESATLQLFDNSAASPQGLSLTGTGQ
ncbi:MAG: choice-of-anchor D domain-containing protein [Bryobacteraceae bacterium]|jgi:sugar lactone lactonase YvrE